MSEGTKLLTFDLRVAYKTGRVEVVEFTAPTEQRACAAYADRHASELIEVITIGEGPEQFVFHPVLNRENG